MLKKSILIVILTSLLLAACNQTKNSTPLQNENPTSGLGDKNLVVAHDVNFPPFEYLEDNQYTGFDLDLLSALAEVCNFTYETKVMDFNGIIPALQAKQVDMAVAALTINPERAQVVDFTIPYYRTGLVLAVKPENEDIVNPDDLKGKTIAVRIGTSGEAYIRALSYADQITIITFDSANDAYLAVANGMADAAINDESNLRYYINIVGTGQLKVVGELLTGDNYGIAVPKGETNLINALNEGLRQLVENGTYDEIYEKWFGVKPSYYPGDF